MEIYIGNIPESKPKSTENTDSGYAQFNPETGHFEKTDDKAEPKQQSTNTETKPKSEFSYCLSSGIVQGVKLYSAPNNDSYVGTITSFCNDISDERGKKTKAVYISGGKIVGGIYDDRLLVKPVKSAIEYMPRVRYELPYDGTKEMLAVDEVENKEFLSGLFNAMYDELPMPKQNKNTKTKIRS